MHYQGSCHCGKIKFDVEGTIDKVTECNCSHCSRKGYLLWFVPREQLKMTSGEGALGTYMFNKRVIQHHFCPDCGCAPFGAGTGQFASTMAVNVRCLEGIDVKALNVVQVDGKNK